MAIRLIYLKLLPQCIFERSRALRQFLILIAAILTVALVTAEAYAQKYNCTNTCVGPPGARTCTKNCY
ncbi:unnamed protein product [marine sediment metagenome]|uniref:Uncharacterized protein n=1 Tax=marine sediment metagenome TaxID=412755 RepID=X0SXD2_9ZZZZ